MKKIEIQEPVRIYRSYVYEVDDDISDKEFIEKVKETDGEVYLVEDNQGINFYSDDILFDSEEHDNSSETLIIKDNQIIGRI